jgi:hypothetical protein
MTAFPNARSMLSCAIDTVTRPYADATATTKETVSQVSSSNFSSIDDDGELFVSSCSGAFLRSSSLLRFLSSRMDKCTGNGGPGLIEHSATMGRLDLGLFGLEGEVFGSSALLARDKMCPYALRPKRYAQQPEFDGAKGVIPDAEYFWDR